MRTEDDLRAAFGSLAPEVLDEPAPLTGVVRASRRRTLRRRAGCLLAAAGLSAAAVVAVTGVTNAPHGQLTATVIRAKLVAAWLAVGDDILVMRIGSPGGGPQDATVDGWLYPWAASPGQRVQARLLISYGGKNASDMSCSYLMPANPVQHFYAQGIDVEYGSWYWSKTRFSGSCGPEMNPSAIRSQIASGAWTVSGPAEFRGHQALKLTQIVTVRKDIARSTSELWVDASTYLPLYEYMTTSGLGSGPPFTAAFELLPPTPANLALLKAVIPAGFTRSPY